MREGVMTEAETCREFVAPWLVEAVWATAPYTKAGLEHADPKDLIASMRSHEAEVMRLLGEIEGLVAEVQA